MFENRILQMWTEMSWCLSSARLSYLSRNIVSVTSGGHELKSLDIIEFMRAGINICIYIFYYYKLDYSISYPSLYHLSSSTSLFRARSSLLLSDVYVFRVYYRYSSRQCILISYMIIFMVTLLYQTNNCHSNCLLVNISRLKDKWSGFFYFKN